MSKRPRRMLKMLGAYWRMKRGATLGAQGIVIDVHGDVLLVRHGYRPGWHFPGGGIEWRETAVDALTRELFEEAGVVLSGTPKLHGLFFNNVFPSDHVAVFIVREFCRDHVPKPNREIVESRFFSPDALPEDIAPAVRRRLAELNGEAALSAYW